MSVIICRPNRTPSPSTELLGAATLPSTVALPLPLVLSLLLLALLLLALLLI